LIFITVCIKAERKRKNSPIFLDIAKKAG
jgi:hypothetical protein